MFTFAVASGFGAVLAANSTKILAVWLVLEQYLAANPKIKGNSTAQVIIGVVSALLQKNQ